MKKYYKKQYTKINFIKKICIALHMLYSKDSYLLKNNINEISIAHKLASYLQLIFQNYNVDIEFNRNKNHAKRINNINRRPDIIIHKRGTKHNYIALEIKKNNNTNINNDKEKIEKLLKELNYKFGIYIEFNVQKNIHYKNFIKEMYVLNRYSIKKII